MSGTDATPDLVVLGNLLVDYIVFADGTTRMGQAGGAILYLSLAAALWGTRVGCVSVRGDDYPAAALDRLRSRGVALDGVRALGGGGVRTWLLYEGAIRRVVHRLGCPSHAAVSPLPEDVPPAWRGARAFHLAPMPWDVQRRLVAAIRGWQPHAFVSVDPHLAVSQATLGEWRELLAHADAFFPSDDEWRLDHADPAEALALLAGGRLRFVAWKRGARGGVFADLEEGTAHAWEPRPPVAVDPTGAGDAFAAGFVTAWLEGGSAEAALRRAVATAGVACGGEGPDGLLAANRDELRARVAASPRVGEPA